MTSPPAACQLSSLSQGPPPGNSIITAAIDSFYTQAGGYPTYDYDLLSGPVAFSPVFDPTVSAPTVSSGNPAVECGVNSSTLAPGICFGCSHNNGNGDTWAYDNCWNAPYNVPSINVDACTANAALINPLCADSTECTFLTYGYLGGDGQLYSSCGSSPSAWFSQHWCLQTAWPSHGAFVEQCCLATDWAADAGSASTYCAPSWNPWDPAGNCGDVFPAYCRLHSVTNENGAWVHGFLGSGTACGELYQHALHSPFSVPTNRWPLIDLEIGDYCSGPDADPVSCGFANFGLGGDTLCVGGSNTSQSCFLYASVSGISPGPQYVPSVTHANIVDGATGFPMGISDYACIAPQCAFAGGGPPPSLIPFEVAFAKLKTCPEVVCAQVVVDEFISAADIDGGGGGVYIGDNVEVCTGSEASITVGMPALQMDAVQSSLVFLNNVSGDCVLGECQGAATLSFVSTNVNTLSYSITTPSNWPSWLVLADPQQVTGSVSDLTQLVELVIVITDTRSVPVGSATTFQVTVSDQIYSQVKARTTLQLIGVPVETPPQPLPPLPNPGTGIPVITENTPPSYLRWVTIAMLGVLALAALTWLTTALTKRQLKGWAKARAAAETATEARRVAAVIAAQRHAARTAQLEGMLAAL
jgi:hypothetical protein